MVIFVLNMCIQHGFSMFHFSKTNGFPFFKTANCFHSHPNCDPRQPQPGPESRLKHRLFWETWDDSRGFWRDVKNLKQTSNFSNRNFRFVPSAFNTSTLRTGQVQSPGLKFWRVEGLAGRSCRSWISALTNRNALKQLKHWINLDHHLAVKLHLPPVHVTLLLSEIAPAASRMEPGQMQLQVSFSQLNQYWNMFKLTQRIPHSAFQTHWKESTCLEGGRGGLWFATPGPTGSARAKCRALITHPTYPFTFHFISLLHLETLICVTEPFQPQANYPKLHSNLNIVSLEMKPRVVSWHVRPGVHLFNPTQCLRHTTLRSNLTDLATSTGMKGRRKNSQTVEKEFKNGENKHDLTEILSGTSGFSFDFSYGVFPQKYDLFQARSRWIPWSPADGRHMLGTSSHQPREYHDLRWFRCKEYISLNVYVKINS